MKKKKPDIIGITEDYENFCPFYKNVEPDLRNKVISALSIRNKMQSNTNIVKSKIV